MAGDTLPDKELIKRAQRGDSAAFAEVVDECYATLFRFAMKYTAQRADAEDIAQQACIKLARSIHTYRFESKFSTWLYRLVLNCARDWQRKHPRDEQSIDELNGSMHESLLVAGGAAEDQILLGQVLERVAGYGDDFLETLVLVMGEGMSHADAAALLDVKASTVSWRIHEIRKRLSAEQLKGVQ